MQRKVRRLVGNAMRLASGPMLWHPRVAWLKAKKCRCELAVGRYSGGRGAFRSDLVLYIERRTTGVVTLTACQMMTAAEAQHRTVMELR
jgi:hypothetical protein